MKRIQIKDALSNIKAQIVTYISIIIIAAVAAMAYLGMAYGGKALTLYGTGVYGETSFRDIELTATMLTGSKDIYTVQTIDGVEDAEGVYVTGAALRKGAKETDAEVKSLTKKMNLPVLTEGRLPSGEGECIVEKFLAEEMGYSLGEEIRLVDSQGETAEYLLEPDYTIVGIFLSSDHISSRVNFKKTVIIDPCCFDPEFMGEHYSKLLVRVKDTEGLDRCEEEYQSTVKEVMAGLNGIAGQMAADRDLEVRDYYQGKIDELAEKLEEAKEELDDLEAELTSAKARLDSERGNLDLAKADLDSTRIYLNNTKAALDQAWPQLEMARMQLEQKKPELDAARAELTESAANAAYLSRGVRQAALNAVSEYLGGDFASRIPWSSSDDPKVDDRGYHIGLVYLTDSVTADIPSIGREDIERLLAPYSDEEIAAALDPSLETDDPREYAISGISSSYIRGCGMCVFAYNSRIEDINRWNEAHDSYISSLDTYNGANASYNERLRDYSNTNARYWQGESDYAYALSVYQSGEAAYASALASYNEGMARFEEGTAEYQAGLEQLALMQEKFDSLDYCRWIIVDSNGNPGYVNLRQNAYSMRGLTITLSLMFIAVAALVIYAGVGKMVDEQASLVGTLKALGIKNGEILGKYLIYGLSSTVIGVGLGVAMAYYVVQKMLLNVQDLFYNFGAIEKVFLPGPTAIVVAGAVLLASGSVYAACSGLLKSSAVDLMNGGGIIRYKPKKAAKERGSLYSRTIFLNMRSDLKRVFATIISIGGCCALLVGGLSLKDSILKVYDKQYRDILRYGFEIHAEGDLEGIEEILEKEGLTYTRAKVAESSIMLTDSLDTANLICLDTKDTGAFINIYDPHTKETLEPGSKGVIISLKMSEASGLKPGDSFIVYDEVMKPYDAKIEGIADYYLGEAVFISKAYYKAVFGKAMEPNCILVSTGEKNAAEVSAALLPMLSETEGFKKIKAADAPWEQFSSFTQMLDSMVAFLIVLSGVMSYFVLFNLINTYLNKKKKELTIMRVNGYTTKETRRYAAIEAVITTVLGIAVGVAVGAVAVQRIILSIESVFLHFVRDNDYMAWAEGAVITAAFAYILNAIAFRKVKRLKLTDAAG